MEGGVRLDADFLRKSACGVLKFDFCFPFIIDVRLLELCEAKGAPVEDASASASSLDRSLLFTETCEEDGLRGDGMIGV